MSYLLFGDLAALFGAVVGGCRAQPALTFAPILAFAGTRGSLAFALSFAAIDAHAVDTVARLCERNISHGKESSSRRGERETRHFVHENLQELTFRLPGLRCP